MDGVNGDARLQKAIDGSRYFAVSDVSSGPSCERRSHTRLGQVVVVVRDDLWFAKGQLFTLCGCVD